MNNILSRFHWGHGIFAILTLFICMLIFALVSSFRVDHSLVYDNYYQYDIEYQKIYEAQSLEQRQNLIELTKSAVDNKLTVFISSEAPINGTIHLYRPSNEKSDLIFDITGKNTAIPTVSLTKGKWLVKINANIGDLNYQEQSQIFI